MFEETGQDAASADLLPVLMGMRRLIIPAPPLLEAAFGYRGDLRFVAFFYSPRNAAVAHSDGGDDLLISNPDDWISFVTHPAMCSELDVCPSLCGRPGKRMLPPKEFQQLPDAAKAHYCRQFHALVLDRLKRRLYVSEWEALKMFQACAEPDEEVHVALPDQTLVSPGPGSQPGAHFPGRTNTGRNIQSPSDAGRLPAVRFRNWRSAGALIPD